MEWNCQAEVALRKGTPGDVSPLWYSTRCLHGRWIETPLTQEETRALLLGEIPPYDLLNRVGVQIVVRDDEHPERGEYRTSLSPPVPPTLLPEPGAVLKLTYSPEEIEQILLDHWHR